MQHLGDYELGETIDFMFPTAAPDTGIPTTLSGSPAISAYVGNGTTEITAGITLTVDFDSRTGLNHVRAVVTSGNGYANDSDIMFVVTAGTVDGNSAVGYVVGRATIGRLSAYKRLGAPAGASVSADIAAAKAVVDAIETDTDVTIPGLIDALNNLSAAAVNAEIVDVIRTDTLAEMAQGAPPAAPTLAQAINYLYRWAVRNKKTVDSSASPTVETVFADDESTELWKRDIADSANVTTFSEAVTGT